MLSKRLQNTSRSISKSRAPLAFASRLVSTSAPSLAGATTEKQKKEGTIASVFASLSGAGENALPSRFRDLKRDMVGSEKHADSMLQAWRQVLKGLQPEVDAIVSKGPEVIPTVQYPGEATARKPLAEWMDAETLADLRRRGVVRIKGVVSKEQALEWKESIKSYVKANPEVRGELKQSRNSALPDDLNARRPLISCTIIIALSSLHYLRCTIFRIPRGR